MKFHFLNNPNHVQALIGRAHIYLSKKHYSEAERDLAIALKIKPDNAYARTLLGEVYFAQQKFKEAKPEFEIILINYPKDKNALNKLAEINQKLQKK